MNNHDQSHDPQLQRRLQRAFASVGAGEDLTARVQAAVDEARRQTPDTPSADQPRVIRFPLRRRLLVPLGAAAAVLLLIAGAYMVHTPGVAHASPIEAIEWMHVKDLQPCRRFKPIQDPNQLEHYIENKLGLEAIVPPAPAGAKYLGGCVRSLWTRPAASYLIQLNDKSASVVIFARTPETLDFPTVVKRHGTTFHTATHGQHNLAAVRVRQATYAIVGDAAPEDLLELLQAVREKAATRP